MIGPIEKHILIVDMIATSGDVIMSSDTD